MSDATQPIHLNSHHRKTVAHIFEHPISHNVEWRSVESLFAAIGTAEELHDGKYRFTVGERSEVFHRPKHKEIDTEQVMNIRHWLSDIGFAAA